MGKRYENDPVTRQESTLGGYLGECSECCAQWDWGDDPRHLTTCEVRSCPGCGEAMRGGGLCEACATIAPPWARDRAPFGGASPRGPLGAAPLGLRLDPRRGMTPEELALAWELRTHRRFQWVRGMERTAETREPGGMYAPDLSHFATAAIVLRLALDDLMPSYRGHPTARTVVDVLLHHITHHPGSADLGLYAARALLLSWEIEP